MNPIKKAIWGSISDLSKLAKEKMSFMKRNSTISTNNNNDVNNQ